MTEEEAKTKWCPFARIDICCIGSRCMAWRAVPAMARNTETGSFHTAAMADMYPNKYERVPAGGYCGLAGEP